MAINPLRDVRILQRRRKSADISPLGPPKALPQTPPPPSTVPQAPSWWKDTPLTASTGTGAETSFLRLANALVPYLAGPEQSAARVFLGSSSLFPGYLNTQPADTTASTVSASVPASQYSQSFMTADRATQALARLDSLRTQAGLSEDQLGPGYKFIRQAINLLTQFGIRQNAGEQGMTRAEYEALQTQLASMVEQAKSDRNLAPYAELAQQFVNPTLPTDLLGSRTIGNNSVYGTPSRRLFN